jgi:hypothetical protein
MSMDVLERGPIVGDSDALRVTLKVHSPTIVRGRRMAASKYAPVVEAIKQAIPGTWEIVHQSAVIMSLYDIGMYGLGPGINIQFYQIDDYMLVTIVVRTDTQRKFGEAEVDRILPIVEEFLVKRAKQAAVERGAMAEVAVKKGLPEGITRKFGEFIGKPRTVGRGKRRAKKTRRGKRRV